MKKSLCSIAMHLVCLASPALIRAQEATAAESGPAKVKPAADQRAFGILANYRTVEPGGDKTPLTTKGKFTLAYRDSIDYPIFAISGVLSAMGQLNNSNPSFGQGMKGYAKRYASGYSDLVLTNILIEGALPSLFHHDPRYYRRGSGSVGGRMIYAATRVFVTPTDSGKLAFNVSEFTGNLVGAGVGNIYYKDGRNVSENVQRFGQFFATDAIGNILKEFWPDLKKKMKK